MKIEGIVTLVFRDKDTGEITKEINQTNNIAYEHIESRILPITYQAEHFGHNIFISAYDPGVSDPKQKAMGRVHEIGFVVSGITSPIRIEATPTTFPYAEWQQRFNAPVANRTINVIGLTADGLISAGAITPMQAHVVLPSPIVQTPTETIDIFYRIQFPYDHYIEPSPLDPTSTKINSSQATVIMYKFTDGVTGDFFNRTMSSWNGNCDFTRLHRFRSEGATHDSYSPYPTPVDTYHEPSHKYEVITNLTIDKATGSLIGHLVFGECGDGDSVNPWAASVITPTTDPTQNLFGHGPASTKPFYDSLEQPVGDGSLVIDGSSWTNPDFPKLYRINITADGAIGASTYQFQVRNHFGFCLNSWQDPVRIMHSMDRLNSHVHDGVEFTVGVGHATTIDDYDHPTIIKYDVVDTTLKHVLAIHKTYVYPFNVQTGEADGPLFNVTNYPTFNPTSITQVTYEAGGTIFVGCRDSGIYKITDPLGSPTITVINNTTPGLTGLAGSPNETKCYGVVVGNGRVWAVFDGGLFSSVDSGANWVQATFNNATITADWWRVKFIQADPTHADQRLCLMYEDTNSTVTSMYIKMLWWDNTSSIDVTGLAAFNLYRGANVNSGKSSQIRYTAGEPWTWFTVLVPSPTQNKWGMNWQPAFTSAPSGHPTYFDFGATTYQQTAISALYSYQMYIDWELSEDGTDQQLLTTTTASASLAYMTLYKSDGTYLQNDILPVKTSNNIGEVLYAYQGAICYLGNLVNLHGQFQYDSQYTPQRFHIHSAGQGDDSTGGPLGFLLWDRYGWNGAWVKGDPGSKPTHLAAETLSDGVTVAFDDATGTQTFITDDYYTCGVAKGVWMDGSTQLIHNTGVYYKSMISGQTDLEAGTLSASIRNPEIFERTPTAFTWQNQDNVTEATDVLRNSLTTTLYDHGARSVEAITGTGITNKSSGDTVHGRFTWGCYAAMTGTRKVTAGLSTATQLLQPISPNSVEYGIQIHPNGVGNECDINIIESSVVVGSALRIIDTGTASAIDFEVEILNDGTINYYLWCVDSSTSVTIDRACQTRDLIYTSSETASIEDYYIDAAFNGDLSAGINVSFTSSPGGLWPGPRSNTNLIGGRRFQSRVADGYYMTVGSFGGSPPTGRYTPNFFSLDMANLNILIAGVAPTLILEDDTTTVLGAGEISVFPRRGFIRYSASDTGKTITANYNVLVED